MLSLLCEYTIHITQDNIAASDNFFCSDIIQQQMDIGDGGTA